ncbi:Hypothetical predicted protein, partial [Paramuricea clavata]
MVNRPLDPCAENTSGIHLGRRLEKWESHPSAPGPDKLTKISHDPLLRGVDADLAIKYLASRKTAISGVEKAR